MKKYFFLYIINIIETFIFKVFVQYILIEIVILLSSQKTEENKSKRVQQNNNELQEKRLKLEANKSKLTGCAQKHQLKQNKSRLLTMSKVRVLKYC